MSDWELIDDGRFNGVRKWLSSTEDDEGTALVRYEGFDHEVIEENKRSDGQDRKSEMWHVGHVPASVGLKWLAEEGVDMWNPAHQDAVLKKLMDSDYRHLVPGLNRIIF